MRRHVATPTSDRPNRSAKNWTPLVRDNGSVVSLTKDTPGNEPFEYIDPMILHWTSPTVVSK